MRLKAVSGIMLTLLLTSVLALALNTEPVSAAVSPYIAVVPASTVNPALTPGMDYTISIYTDYNGSDVWGYEITLTYNPNVLEGIEVVNGDLITEDVGTILWHPGTFNNTSGELGLTGNGFFFSDLPPPVTSGSGIMANITFSVVGYGDSYISLGNETRLIGYNDIMENYNIIDSATMQDQIHHGFFSNVPPTIHDIYIRADGSIDPPTANITSLDNITYTFTDNIYDSIVVERDNIVIDGNGYTNTGSGTGNGLDLSSRSNVTVKNAKIESFDIGIYLFNSSMHACGIELNENTIANNTQIGIYLEYSSNNTITRNNVTNNGDGMGFLSSFINTVSKNNITNNNYGVFLCKSSYNTLSSNNIADNYEAGVGFDLSFYNNITKNNIADNAYGVKFLSYSENNTFLHNSFIDNIQQVYLISPHVPPIANFWNNSYPIGNFWNDYEKRYPEAKDAYRGPYQNETGSDGIWDYPYIIDEYNIDNYPIVPEFPSLVILQLFMIATLLAVIIYRRKRNTNA